MSNEATHTSRITVPELEALLNQEIPVGSNGFMSVVDYMGTDASIANAARVSYKGQKSIRSDEDLIAYLMRHNHGGPFEFAEITLHIKCPAVIAQQWSRHRTANINEKSGRYVTFDPEHTPMKALYKQSTNNKQGRDRELIENNDQLCELAEQCMSHSEEVYSQLVQAGVAKEIARFVLPMGEMTEFYWKIDLRNLMNFLRLRLHSTAQYEIRQYAQEMFKIVEKWVPLSCKAFKRYQLDSFTLTRQAVDYLRGDKGAIDQMTSGERRDFKAEVLQKLGIDIEDSPN